MTKEQFSEVKELAKQHPVLEDFLAVFKSETVETLMALRKFQKTMNALINKMKNLDLKEKDFEKISKYLLDADKYNTVDKSLTRDIFSDPDKKEECETKRATEQIAV